MTPQAMEYLKLFITAASVAFAIYMGLRGNRLADSADREERIRTETRMDVKLNDVLLAAKDTRDSVKELQKDILKQNNRLITIEETVKEHARRIDTVEQKLSGG